MVFSTKLIYWSEMQCWQNIARTAHAQSHLYDRSIKRPQIYALFRKCRPGARPQRLENVYTNFTKLPSPYTHICAKVLRVARATNHAQANPAHRNWSFCVRPNIQHSPAQRVHQSIHEVDLTTHRSKVQIMYLRSVVFGYTIRDAVLKLIVEGRSTRVGLDAAHAIVY